jgi:hypothetical protein
VLHCCYTLAEKALADQSSGLGCADVSFGAL